MKKTIYFKNQQEMLDYYGGDISNVPSNMLAIVADESDYVLFSTSNNITGSTVNEGGYIVEGGVSGYAYITSNGDHNIATYEMVNVDVPIPSGYVYVNGTYNISENGTFDISTYENAYVSVEQGIFPTDTSYVTVNGLYDISTYSYVDVAVPSSGQTIAQKNAAWQTKWSPALSTMAAGLYAQDPSYGEPQITSPSGWCVQTALDGNAAMSELIALDSLWIEIFGYGSNLHEQYVQIFTQMGLTLDSDGNLVSTDDDKILPFDVDEAIVTNLTGVLGLGCLGGKKISSLNGGIENAKWNYYGTVFNGTGFDYAYIGQFDRVVDQLTMVNQMQRDGITFISNIPAVNQNTLYNYLTDFQLDGTVIPTGTNYVTVNGNYDISSFSYVNVAVQSGGGGTSYTIIDPSLSPSLTLGSYYEFSGKNLYSTLIDSSLTEQIPALSPYIGSYFIEYTNYGAGNDDVTVMLINDSSLSSYEGKECLVRGSYILDIDGLPVFDTNQNSINLLYQGGEGTSYITSNTTGSNGEYVGNYQYVKVDVHPWLMRMKSSSELEAEYWYVKIQNETSSFVKYYLISYNDSSKVTVNLDISDIYNYYSDQIGGNNLILSVVYYDGSTETVFLTNTDSTGGVEQLDGTDFSNPLQLKNDTGYIYPILILNPTIIYFGVYCDIYNTSNIIGWKGNQQ